MAKDGWDGWDGCLHMCTFLVQQTPKKPQIYSTKKTDLLDIIIDTVEMLSSPDASRVSAGKLLTAEARDPLENLRVITM